MKCAYYQKQKKDQMTTESRKRLNEVVDNFVQKSIVRGPEKALEFIREECEWQKNVEWLESEVTE